MSPLAAAPPVHEVRTTSPTLHELQILSPAGRRDSSLSTLRAAASRLHGLAPPPRRDRPRAAETASAKANSQLRGRTGIGVYCRLGQTICEQPQAAKERPMAAKRPDRREFLRGGAALAGGLTVGAVEPALGQAPEPERYIRGDADMVAYGQRSPFETSVRIPHPPGGRESPDAFGLVFHVAAPLQDSVGVITPSSLHFVGTTRGSLMPEIDPERASPHDPRPGGPAADLHHGGAEAPPVGDPPALHRVRGEPGEKQAQDRPGNARDDQLRRMDRACSCPRCSRRPA